MQNTVKKMKHAIAALGLTLGLFMSSFASHAIILEYDYETVNAANNEYLFNFNISDLASFIDKYFEFEINFNNSAGTLDVGAVDIYDFGPNVALDYTIYPASGGFPAVPVGKTSIQDLLWEYYVADPSFDEPTAISIFSNTTNDYNAPTDGAITGISVFLRTTGILASDIVVKAEGFIEDSNTGNLEMDFGVVTGSNTTVIQPPTVMSAPSNAALFLSCILFLALGRKTKK